MAYKLNTNRKAAIECLQNSLKDVRAVDKADWVLGLAATLVFFKALFLNTVAAVRTLIVGWITALLTIIALPFLAIYMWFDLLLITIWYISQLLRRMKGE